MADRIPFTDIRLTVPFAAQGPGPVVDTLGDVEGTPVIEIEAPEYTLDDTSGELSMTTVSIRTEMTLAQALGRWLFTDDQLVPIEQIFPPNQSPEEVEESNRNAFIMSESAATTAAMNHLDVEVESVVVEVMDNAPAEGVVEAEDVLTHVDGQPVNNPSHVQEVIRSNDPGAEVELRFQRAGNEHTETVTLGEAEDGSAQLGVLLIAEPVEDIEVTYNLQDIGGPSAGMMFALAVIDKLSEGELNGGHKVAGTGTISADGTVGSIGGISHKVTAAAEEGSELFLAPSGNCAEALQGNAQDMVIAQVDTLDDAVQAMEDFAAGNEVNVCS